MSIAIVILNWNGKKLLEQFLPSVVRYSLEATIYVADNASSDDSLSFVSENFSEVKIIQNSENGGYAKGYNDALKELTEDIFVLLNNDVEVSEGWLQPVLKEFKNNMNIVAAQPKILDYNNRECFEYAGAAGGFIDSMGYPFCRGRIFGSIEKDEGQYDDSVQIFWATGACLFVKRIAFLEVGGFDEDLFTHQEEIDLCWRMQAHGGVIQYVGTSKIYHLGGGTLAAENPKKTFYNFRNTLLVLVKNVPGTKIVWLIFKRLLLDAVAAIQFLFQGKPSHFLAIFKAHISFYSKLSIFLKKRKKTPKIEDYYRIKSVVWKYFISKKRNFNNL